MYGQSKNPVENIHPDVMNLLKPIIDANTMIMMGDLQNRQGWYPNPIEAQKIKNAKLCCVHLAWIDGKATPQLETVIDKDGKTHLKCKMCDREIGMEFSKDMVKTLLDARKIVEQIMYVGMMNHMSAPNLNLLIQMKSVLPYVVQMFDNLTGFVSKDDSLNDSVQNVGIEYQNGAQITGYGI